MAAATAQVPATIRSGTVRCEVGDSEPGGTPSISIVEVPAPATLAPIWISMSARSTISGSRAALSMTVVPLASTAAMRMFSVAPTLGKSSHTVAPVRPFGASVRM
jgi:hypothetical protein